MTKEELDTQIAELEAEASKLREDADVHAMSFVDLVVSETAKALPESVKSFTKRHASVSEALIKAGKFDNVKAQLKAEFEAIDTRLREALTRNALWPHRVGYQDDGTRSPPDHGSVYEVRSHPHEESNPPHVLRRALERTLDATVGKVLGQHGYPSQNYAHAPSYPLNIGIPKGFVPILRAYTPINKQLHQALAKLDAAKSARTQLLVSSAWDD